MKVNQPATLFGVILAGGSGTRFWPLSRSQYPKQVLRLLGSESMIQATIERLLPRIPQERLAVVTNAAQADVIRLELYRKGWDDIRLWLEPQARNTAAAVGLAAAKLGAQAGSQIMAVFPADHFIQDQPGLLQALDQGARLAAAGYLVTFGITPTRPDTGYGYIKAGAALDQDRKGFHCEEFIEKPPLATAAAFLDAGCYSWNSGIFMFRRDVLWEAFARHLPELYEGLNRLADPRQANFLEEIYRELPSISLDHGIMERADNVAVVPVDLGWSDVGTWGAFYDIFDKDERGNVSLGPHSIDQDSRDCLFFSQNRLIATLGLKDTIVIDTPDASLVCHRERVQEVKDLVGLLARRNLAEAVQHPKVERPWGRYTVMDAGPGYQVKQIEVDPGKRLSLQLHEFRAEHWVVVQGTAQVTIGQELTRISSNESVYVPLKTPHRLENPGTEPVRIIEVQTGSYLGEDDIVRLDDDFWRGPHDNGGSK
jgi:mannose-1-phosphate guanylyltransferase / mannose-6-phosphate isomerase